MKLEQLKQKVKNDGKYKSIVYKTEKGNGYSKQTKAVVRFVRYSKMKNGNPNPKKNPTEVMIFDNVIQNTNTGNILVQVAITQNPKLRAKSTYFHNGTEITEEEYHQAIPSHGNATNSVFRIKAQDIISIA